MLNNYLNRKFSEIRNLKEGWDGYSAPPIRKDLIDKLEDILQKGDFVIDPNIVPTLGGRIAADWHFGKEEVSITFADFDEGRIHIEYVGEGVNEYMINEENLSYVEIYLKEKKEEIKK